MLRKIIFNCENLFSAILLAVVLAVLVPSVLSQVPGRGRCPQTSVVQNFNVQRYLGKWYEIKSFFAIFQAGGSCTQANYGLNPNGTVSVLNKMVRLGQQQEILGYARLAQPGVGKLIVNFPNSPRKFCYHNYSKLFLS
jgi:apolipoprotein D and lipocalin family protein